MPEPPAPPDLLPGLAASVPACESRPRRRTWLVLSGVAVTLLCAVAVAFFLITSVTGNIQRIPHVFRGLDQADRPVMPAASRSGMTILVAGSDILSPTPTTGRGHQEPPFEPGEQRSDVLMMVHIGAGGRQASIVSIPRDSWVPVPGHGMMKINAALSLGGPPLMIETVEDLTHVRIDHYMVVDFRGFSAMVGALGGVDVDVAQQTTTGTFTFRQGVNELTPATALVYVRQRDGLPGGDLSRIQRQQNLIRAILLKASSSGTLTDPVATYRLLQAFTSWVSVDSTLSNARLLSLLVEARNLHGNAVSFLTAPVSGFGQESGQDVDFLDKSACTQLWSAIRTNSVGAWAKAHPAAVTPGDPP